MSLRKNETVIRMGPITVIALLIVIALATLGVLSLTTARATQIAADKQDAAIVSMYANESAAQQFLADVDAQLAGMRGTNATPADAAAAIGDATADGITVQKVFESDTRKLTVILVVREDLSYQVVSWKSESTADTREQVQLWQGSEENA